MVDASAVGTTDEPYSMTVERGNSSLDMRSAPFLSIRSAPEVDLRTGSSTT